MMSKNDIVVYEKPTCTKCRQANGALTDKGLLYTRVNYYEEPLSHKKLAELLRKLNLRAAEILRDSEPLYRELGLAKKKEQMSEDELIDLMIKHPDLMQRPIVERGDRAVLARPTENLEKLLK
jgi:arsenate reductase (glutaredoxin)